MKVKKISWLYILAILLILIGFAGNYYLNKHYKKYFATKIQFNDTENILAYERSYNKFDLTTLSYRVDVFNIKLPSDSLLAFEKIENIFNVLSIRSLPIFCDPYDYYSRPFMVNEVIQENKEENKNLNVFYFPERRMTSLLFIFDTKTNYNKVYLVYKLYNSVEKMIKGEEGYND
jgi:hypothetical protein